MPESSEPVRSAKTRASVSQRPRRRAAKALDNSQPTVLEAFTKVKSILSSKETPVGLVLPEGDTTFTFTKDPVLPSDGAIDVMSSKDDTGSPHSTPTKRSSNCREAGVRQKRKRKTIVIENYHTPEATCTPSSFTTERLNSARKKLAMPENNVLPGSSMEVNF